MLRVVRDGAMGGEDLGSCMLPYPWKVLKSNKFSDYSKWVTWSKFACATVRKKTLRKKKVWDSRKIKKQKQKQKHKTKQQQQQSYKLLEALGVAPTENYS